MVTTSQNKYLLFEVTGGQFGTPPPAGELQPYSPKQPDYITWSEVEPDTTDDERPTYGQPSVTVIQEPDTESQEQDTTSQGLDSAAKVLAISVAHAVHALAMLVGKLVVVLIQLVMLIVAAILQGFANGIMSASPGQVTPNEAKPSSVTPNQSPSIQVNVQVNINTTANQ